MIGNSIVHGRGVTGSTFSWLAVCAAAVSLGVAMPASAQSYDFSESFWGMQSPLESGESYEVPELFDPDWFLGNDTDENLDVDMGYASLGLGNASRLDGNALYGRILPEESLGFVNFSLDGLATGGAQSLSFDLAWTAQESSVDYFASDSQGSDENGGIASLFETFPLPGGGTGHEGRVTIDAAALGLADMGEVLLEIFDGVTPPAGETDVAFAIDNLELYQGPGDPLDSDLRLPSTIHTNSIRKAGSVNSNIEVDNIGGGDTTYSVAISGDLSDPTFPFEPGDTNVPIAIGETKDPGAWYSYDRDQPSGPYSGQITITNDLNPSDTDDTVVDFTYDIIDPAILTANDGPPNVLPTGGDELEISNADVEPHDKAIRAIGKITERTVSGDGFGVLDMEVDTLINPGDTVTGSVTHDPTGLLNGPHFGSFLTTLIQRSAGDSFLNSAPPPSMFQWDLESVVTGSTGGIAHRENGQSLQGLGATLNGMDVVIRDGTVTTGGPLEIMMFPFVSDPQVGDGLTTGLSQFGEIADVQFSETGNLFVLELSYDDTGMSAEEEASVRLVVFDDGLQEWVNAVDLNSVPGGPFFAKGFNDYLVEDTTFGEFQLGDHGLDITLNRVWAVIDHNSLFSVAIGGVIPEPASLVLLACGVPLLLSRKRG